MGLKCLITETSTKTKFLAEALLTLGATLWLASCSSTKPSATPDRSATLASTSLSCPKSFGPIYAGQNLSNRNFHSAPAGSLRNANFTGANLTGANFSGQDLTGAVFENANLGASAQGPADFTKTTLRSTCFIGAALNATDFTYATLHCTNFQNTSMINARFGPSQQIEADSTCRTSFVGATLDMGLISTSNWGKCDFANAEFLNTSGKFTLAGQDIQGALLGGTNFTGIDMTGANLAAVDFSNATLIAANMTSTALNGSNLSSADLSSATLKCARFYGSKADNQDNPNGAACPSTPDAKSPNVAATLSRAKLRGADLTNATLNFAVLTGADLSGATPRYASFIQATLEATGGIPAASVLGVDLTGASFKDTHINYVSFSNAILAKAIFDGMTLAGTDFSNSNMPSASFYQAVLENVRFNGAILQNANFRSAILKDIPGNEGSGVIFDCAQLGGADFTNATINDANFLAAVMPPASACCPQPGQAFCGTVSITQQAYGPVTYPVLQTAVTCPNGEAAKCIGNQWLIPSWQTTLCNPGGITQTVWTPPSCSGSTGDNVTFKDANLKNCILQSLPGSPSEVSVQTAAQIPNVSCPGRGIADLTGLEQFTGLIALDLSSNKLTQYSLKLPKLQTLKLENNQITQIDLGGSNNVITLDASQNKLETLAHLANVYLMVLDVSYNNLPSFDLPIQTTLVYANLSHNKLTDVLDAHNTSLRSLVDLQYLDLSYNSLTTIGSTQSISATKTGGGDLESLFLACNPSFDCTSLGIDGKYIPLQTSQCATFNAQTNQWVVNAHPACPTGS